MARPRKSGDRYACGRLKPKRLASLARPNLPKLKRRPPSDAQRLEELEWEMFFFDEYLREEREPEQQAAEGGSNIRAWRAADDDAKR